MPCSEPSQTADDELRKVLLMIAEKVLQELLPKAARLISRPIRETTQPSPQLNKSKAVEEINQV
jgi:hypothetical protein